MKDVKTIDKYISEFSKDVQEILEKFRSVIHSVAPEASEVISYGIPTFKLNGKNLVHFAALKNHIGFYPTPSGVDAFNKETTKYASTKGAIQFPLEEDIPFGLVTKIVKFRVQQVLSK